MDNIDYGMKLAPLEAGLPAVICNLIGEHLNHPENDTFLEQLEEEIFSAFCERRISDKQFRYLSYEYLSHERYSEEEIYNLLYQNQYER